MSMLNATTTRWVVLAIVIAVSLSVDLLAHRRDRPESKRAALLWSLLWVGVAASFGVYVGLSMGATAAEQYFAAWLLEKSLSVDNLFVFLVIFGALGIQGPNQRRVLTWGILGAIVTRGAFIAVGTAALARWHWLVYLLGALLIGLGLKMLMPPAPGAPQSRVLGFLRRFLPVTTEVEGHRFLLRREGRTLATPLLLALLAIEATDVLFAIDSIPAAFAVSESPFILYSSNLFAVLGLRALYVLLSSALVDLHYLRHGLAAVLCFAGVKMLVNRWVHLPALVSLGVIVLVVGAAVAASLWRARRKAPAVGGEEAAPLR
jgi:tellurite resistance protein TerC